MPDFYWLDLLSITWNYITFGSPVQSSLWCINIESTAALYIGQAMMMIETFNEVLKWNNNKQSKNEFLKTNLLKIYSFFYWWLTLERLKQSK